MENMAGKRILMTLTRFDIGGAETHVLELSLELQRMGYYVVVASNGGVYEKNLEEAGIHHYKVPMHSKKPAQVKKSLKLLKDIIKKEQIEIVHAHGRIPAFLCGILNKVMNFTFVTTAHWVFDTSHGLKYITNWGKKVIAVSEDIKTYLIDNYKTNPTDIYVTINGIDTNKFSKNADCSDIMEEFSLEQNTKKIVYISRMDEDRALVAFHLAEIVPELVKINPDIEVVIVGGGNVYDKLEKKVNEINARLGKRYIVLTGGRTDIYKFCALSDFFVGVSRSALEAMACEKPVIVAGNEGYLGIFDTDKLQNAIDTNFCCRGLEASTPALLLSDLKTLLTNDASKNARLGEYSREIILKNYSLAKMAGDCEKMYKAALDSKKWDAVLLGYYGFKNSGDETLLYSMIQKLKEKKDDIRLLVLSKDPAETEKAYGVYSMNRFDIFNVRSELKKSKLFIFGGGSLIQDVTSDKSLWYYLNVLKAAHSVNTPVMLYANGIGPVNKQKNREKVAEMLDKVDLITLRDEESMAEIKRMGVKQKAIVTADPALSMQGISSENARELLCNAGIAKDAKILGISIRNWKMCSHVFWKEFAKGIDEICKEYSLTPVWIPLKQPEDIEISREIQSKMSTKGYVLTDIYSPEEIVGIAGECELMVAMRLHSLIYAAAKGVPSIGITYDPKVSGFVNYIGTSTTLEIGDFNTEMFSDTARELMSKRDSIKDELSEKIAELRKKSDETAQMAIDIINKEE